MCTDWTKEAQYEAKSNATECGSKSDLLERRNEILASNVAQILTDECLEKLYLTARARMGPSTARKST
jgi:hypothetical protein